MESSNAGSARHSGQYLRPNLNDVEVNAFITAECAERKAMSNGSINT